MIVLSFPLFTQAQDDSTAPSLADFSGVGSELQEWGFENFSEIEEEAKAGHDLGYIITEDGTKAKLNWVAESQLVKEVRENVAFDEISPDDNSHCKFENTRNGLGVKITFSRNPEIKTKRQLNLILGRCP